MAISIFQGVPSENYIKEGKKEMKLGAALKKNENRGIKQGSKRATVEKLWEKSHWIDAVFLLDEYS